MRYWHVIFIFLFGVWDLKGQPAESEVAIQTDQGLLFGSLITGKKSKPAVLLIAGSGPTDRNGNSRIGYENNSLKYLAEAISAAGYTTLRYDKRIFSKDSAAFISESDLTFDRIINDAKYVVEHLKALGYKKIIAVGHSQGALVATEAAKEENRIVGVIAIAGASRPIDQIILDQISQQAPILVDPLKIKLDSIKSGFDVSVDNPFLSSLIRPDIQGFLRSYMSFDPTESIRTLSVPTLIINGTTDLQVKPTEAEALAEASKNGQLVIIDQMNHVLKSSTEDINNNLSTYNNPSLPIKEELVSAVLTFIKKL